MRSDGTWRPERKDAFLEGELGELPWQATSMIVRLRQIYSVPETWIHIAERHAGEFDVPKARLLLPGILEQPEVIYRSLQRDNSLLVAGRYDLQHYLVIVLKILENVLWLATVYKDRDFNTLRRAAKSGMLYRR